MWHDDDKENYVIAQIRLIARKFRARYVFGMSLLASAVRVGLYLIAPVSTPVTIALTLSDVLITSIVGEQLIRVDHFDQDVPGHAVARVG